MKQDNEFIKAAIAGFEQQRLKIDDTIAELNRQLRGDVAPEKKSAKGQLRGRAPLVVVEKKKRKMSAAGRAALQAALKRRWAAYHKAKKAS